MHVGCAKLHDLGDAYTCTRNPLTQWESGRPWVSRSLSWSWGHLFLISITNFLSHVFFLSLDIRINGWETKETLPAATNYSIALLPFLIHKCVKCLRNKKHIRKKKRNSTAQQKFAHLLTLGGCGRLSQFSISLTVS